MSVEEKKKIRVCRARISVPSIDGLAATLYTCNVHPLDANFHREVGRIRSKDGKVRAYSMLWWGEETEVWR